MHRASRWPDHLRESRGGLQPPFRHRQRRRHRTPCALSTTIWRLMRVRFWGTRGSVPTPGQSTVRYGGNTACVELRTSAGAFIIFDSGTGIRELGLHLARQGGPVAAHLMLGHTHWDHISGFPFFTPLFVPGNHVTIYGARDLDRSLRDVLAG